VLLLLQLLQLLQLGGSELSKSMSMVMPTMGVAAALVIVVEMLDRDQPRATAIIALGPRSVDLAGRIIISLGPGPVELGGRIGIAWTRCLGTGRETGQ
jgi:hypothetical protein